MKEKKIKNASVDAATVSKNMMWNIGGSMFYIGAQWIISVLIVHLADYEQAGYLNLALSISNIFATLCYFYIRSYQVSDAKGEFSDSQYVTHRWLLTVVSIVTGTLFIVINRYEIGLAAFLILFLIYRVSEPNADVYHGIDQKSWRLDIAGKSFIMRGVISLAAFIGLEMMHQSLALVSLVMAVGVWLVILFYDIPQARKLSEHRISLEMKPMWKLTTTCFPLFLYFMCINMVMPVPRYFLEKIEGGTILGYYASVAVPASMIPMLVSYIFNPFVGLFTEYTEKGNKRAFLKLFWGIAGTIVVITIGAIIGSILLGEWVLTLVFTEEIRPYAYLLIPTAAMCGVVSMVEYFGMLLTVLRDKSSLMIGAVAAAVIVTAASYPAIKIMGVDGINVAILTGCIIALVYMGWRLYVDCSKLERL